MMAQLFPTTLAQPAYTLSEFKYWEKVKIHASAKWAFALCPLKCLLDMGIFTSSPSL